MTKKKSHSLAIAGGGITGLTAAYYAIKNGQDPKSITVYEAASRLGGKIKTGYMSDGRAVNMGAEFIDTSHSQLIDLCQELNVPLKAAGENEGKESFQTANGKTISGDQFHAEFGPLHAQIMRDKSAVLAEPDGALAQRINRMSMQEYLEDIRVRTPIDVHPGFFQQMKHFLSGSSNMVRPEISDMAMHAFASETGRPAQQINALQFLHEVSAEKGAFLESDCGFRVEGGTENIIRALEEKLKEQGVTFEQNAEITKVGKTDHGVAMQFANGKTVEADKVVMALPAYALGKVDGLESLGMSAKVKDFISNTQYTKGFKFTVKLKPGQQAQEGAFFADGYQVWSANRDEVTFLVNSDPAKGEQSPSQVVEACLQDYAKSKGVKADAYFDQSPGNLVFSNPGKNACYASPAPGRAQQLEHLDNALSKMADNGVAIAGTYIPLKTKNSIGLGFMECGVNSSSRAIERLLPQQHARAGWMEHLINPQLQRGGREQPVAAR